MTSPDFRPPDSAYAQAVPWTSGTDPIVTPPGAGVGAWFQRIINVFKQFWRPLAVIFAITTLLPGIFFAVVGVLAAAVIFPLEKEFIDAAVQGRTPSYEDFNVGLAAVILIVVSVLTLALVALQLTGYAAATYLTTRQAAGLPTTIGEAMSYGFRRCLGLFGWQLVVGLMVVGGILLCFLPGLYLAAATALVGPIYLFERRSPIGRSFTIFHQNLGRILGRLALVVAVSYGGSIVISILENVAKAFMGSTVDPTVALPGTIAVSVVGTILALPLSIFVFIGILLTYAEQRAHERPTSAVQLAAEL